MNTLESKAPLSDGSRSNLVDSMGWAAFFVWIGIALYAEVGWGAALIGMGLIVLAGQLARRMMSLPGDGWGMGICLVTVGLLLWLDVRYGTASFWSWVIPALFVAAGLMIGSNGWRRAHRH